MLVWTRLVRAGLSKSEASAFTRNLFKTCFSLECDHRRPGLLSLVRACLCSVPSFLLWHRKGPLLSQGGSAEPPALPAPVPPALGAAGTVPHWARCVAPEAAARTARAGRGRGCGVISARPAPGRAAGAGPRPPRHVGREAAALGPWRRGKAAAAPAIPCPFPDSSQHGVALQEPPGGGSLWAAPPCRSPPREPLASLGRTLRLPICFSGQGDSHRSLDQVLVQDWGKGPSGRSKLGGRGRSGWTTTSRFPPFGMGSSRH